MTNEAQYKEEARRLRPKMMRTARQYLDHGEAEDVVQDCLARLWQLRESLTAPLDRIAVVMTRNLSIDHLRRRHHQTGLEGIEIADETTHNDNRYEAVMRIIDTLPAVQQAVMRLRHIDEMAFTDIAETMNMTPEAVRQAASRARRAILKQYIKQ